MSRRALGPQFDIRHQGPWYHGAARSDYEQLEGSARFNMPGYLHGHTYATQDISRAEDYARSSHRDLLKEHPELEGEKGVEPTVYEVAPSRSWEPDPHGGMSGWNDGMGRREAMDYMREGGTHDVGFPNPVKIAARHPVER
jgi:hypothetical protein